MALTLAEANTLSNDQLRAGVIETIVQESPFLAMLPIITVIGTALRYTRETTKAGMDFHPVGGTWTESTGTRTNITATLGILGGDADVDNFLRMSRADTNDLEAIIVAEKVKAFVHKMEETIVYGDVDVDANSFDGLHEIIDDLSSDQQLHMGSGGTPGALTLTKLRELIDAVRPGKPTALMMSRRTRRGLSKLSASLTSPVNYEPNEFGARTMFFDGIPIVTNDFMLDTETISGGAYASSTGGASTSIFAMQMGEDGLALLSAGEFPALEPLGPLETKDADRWRVKGYVGMALFRTLAVARLDGISSADVTA